MKLGRGGTQPPVRHDQPTRPPVDVLAEVLEHSPAALLVTDAAGVVIAAGRSFERTFLGGRSVTGFELSALTSHPRHLPTDDILTMALDSLANGGDGWGLCTSGWTSTDRWFEVFVTTIGADVGGVLVEAHDITGPIQMARSHRRTRHRDHTTELLSRSGVLDWLQRELTEHPGHQFCVAMLQVDQFDIIDDSLGPRSSDELLAQVARNIAATLGPESVAAHTERATFCVVTPCTTAAEAAHRATELRDAVRQPIAARGRTLRLTASVGTSFTADHWTTVRAVREAEVAMLEARRRGGNRYAPYVPDQMRTTDGVLRRWDALSDALQYRQMEVWYQPMVDLASGRPTGAEALCRWHHPQLGEVSPLDFIPLAEWGAEITRLGAFVQDSAAHVVSAVRSNREANTADFVVGINISAHELAVPHFATGFLGRMMANATDADCLAVEIGEDSLTTDDVATAANLRALAGAGIRIAVGDFGTRGSSAERLLALPVSTLKISRRFVARMTVDEVAARVVASTIALARELGIDVVAEGVETPVQAAELARLGCHAAQGFLYAPAVTGGELAGVVRDLAGITSR